MESVKFNILSFIKEHSQEVAVIKEQNCSKSKYDFTVNFGTKSSVSSLLPSIEALLQRSISWEISLLIGIIENNKLLLSLSRKSAFYTLFNVILNDGTPFGYQKSSGKSITVTTSLSLEKTHLTAHRQSLLHDVVKNLLIVGGYHLTEHGNVKIVLTTKNSQNGIYIAPVCSQESKSDMAVEDYFRLRENDIKSIAEHKYWDSNGTSTIRILAAASVAIDLIANKHSNIVKLNTDDKSVAGTREMSNKGAAFLLYNVARLSSIEKKYDEKVREGLFPPLPALEEVDVSFLSQQEEWQLLFNFIMVYPSVLSRSIALIEENQMGQHHLCTFLFKFCKVFSMYYRRYRILQEPKLHLLPIIFARLYLAKTINKVLKQALQILNIDLLESM